MEFIGSAIQAFLVVLCLALVAGIVDYFVLLRSEFRRGHTAQKTSFLLLGYRAAEKLLRVESGGEGPYANIFQVLFVIVAIGFLPLSNGFAPIVLQHSLWFFCILLLVEPIFFLVFTWTTRKTGVWPNMMRRSERALCGSVTLFLIVVSVEAITATDSFLTLLEIQSKHTWLLLSKPALIPASLAFLVLVRYLSFLPPFAGPKFEEVAGGWLPSKLSLLVHRICWNLFFVFVFMGGAGSYGFVGGLGIIIAKSFVVEIFGAIISSAIVSTTENQAEKFLLWHTIPLVVISLFLALFSGGI